ncbi:MAG: PAS domain S-box protein [Nitrospirae bacterium]|nr:PAS domain S-box protein [Nitrospirota bacterium]
MNHYRIIGKMLLISALLGVLFWLLDSAVDSYLLESSFLHQIVSLQAGELWMRLFVFLSFIGFGFYAGVLISRAEKAEEMSRRDREFTETVLNGMHDAISVIDTHDFRIVDVNAAFLSEMGLTRNEVIGKTCHEVTHRSAAPCAAPGHPCPLYDTVNLGRYATYEHVHFCADGRKIHAEVSTSPIRNDSGQVVRVIHVSRNITARKAAETQMRKLSTAVEKAADMIVITNSSGVIEYVNPAFENLTGYTREEAVGKTPRILKSGLHSDDFYRQLWETILAGKIYRDVFINRKKNGELYYDECTITPMRNEQNVITHFIATAKVITERIVAENALRESEERMRTITEMAGSAIVMIDADGAVSFWNPAAERLFGYLAEEAMGKDLHKIIVPRRHYEDFRKGFAVFATTGAGAVVGKTLEMTAQKKDGTEFPVDLSISGIRIKDQWHAVGIIGDITERKQAEQKLREFAEKDALTGILNRRKFYEILEQEKARAERYARSLSLIMFDIDHFKAVNDTFGHAAGDKVLKKTAAVVIDHIRKSDVLGRIGGEEFAVLATETTVESALALAEKIRAAIENTEHDTVGTITISIGVSAYDSGLSTDEFVRRSDEALYAAKNNGRNRVECYSTHGPVGTDAAFEI